MFDNKQQPVRIGSRVFVEDACEDVSGAYIDDYAEVIGIANDGELRLKFETPQIEEFYGHGAVGAGYGTETPVEVVEY